MSCVTHPLFFLLCLSVGGKGNPRQKTDGETALHRFPNQIGEKPEGIYIPSFSTFLEPDKILWAATKMLLMFADIYAPPPLAARTVNFSAACFTTVYCSLYFSGGGGGGRALKLRLRLLKLWTSIQVQDRMLCASCLCVVTTRNKINIAAIQRSHFVLGV